MNCGEGAAEKSELLDRLLLVCVNDKVTEVILLVLVRVVVVVEASNGFSDQSTVEHCWLTVENNNSQYIYKRNIVSSNKNILS